MASHGVTRISRPRTDEQRLQDAEKIKTYRDLESQIRTHIRDRNYTPEAFQLTTKLLRLNPEYYTIWNDRRRLLTSGSFSRRSAGSSPSKASSSTSPSATTTPSSGSSSSLSSGATPLARSRQLPIGKTSSTAGGEGRGEREDQGESGRNEKEEGELDAAIRAELAFTIPLLMDFPKCYWIWNHRLWVLEQAIALLPTVATARRIWEDELALDSKMLTRDKRNFHAWEYRRHIVRRLEDPVLGGKDGGMVEQEFEYTTRMIHVDLSNFSAWHNRSKLIPRLLDGRGADDVARRKFLDDELELIQNALNVGPEDQSLWYYHQYLMLNLTGDKSAAALGERPSMIAPSLSHDERVGYVKRQIEDITELLEDYDTVKWIYQVLVDYTIALTRLEERSMSEGEWRDMHSWVSKLQQLDPMRKGRWSEIEMLNGL